MAKLPNFLNLLEGLDSLFLSDTPNQNTLSEWFSSTNSSSYEELLLLKIRSLILQEKFSDAASQILTVKFPITNSSSAWLQLWELIVAYEEGEFEFIDKLRYSIKTKLDYLDYLSAERINQELMLLDSYLLLHQKNYNKSLDLLRHLSESSSKLIKTKASNLLSSLTSHCNINNFYFASPCMLSILKELEKAALRKDQVILIQGSVGAGKTQLAQTYTHILHKVHKIEFPESKPFSIPTTSKELILPELFGSIKGAYTGALNKKGFFETYNGGVLILDEISELPLDAQPILLQVLQEKIFRKVGSNSFTAFSGTVICLTNKDLSLLVEQNLFRSDLLSRINKFVINVPPLIERVEEIEYLSRMLISKSIKENNLPFVNITNEAISYLKTRPYPGNVRELENLIDYLITESIHLSKLGQIPTITRKMLSIHDMQQKQSNPTSFPPLNSSSKHISEANLIGSSPASIKNPIEDPVESSIENLNKTNKLFPQSPDLCVLNQQTKLANMSFDLINQAENNYLMVAIPFNKGQPLATLAEYEQDFVKIIIENALHKNQFNITKTAQELGISRTTLHEKIKSYGIKIDKVIT